ncbi:hypothetical protein AB7310_08950 [Cylindrospermopsis raciborskii UAM/DH-BiRr]|uniref:hypothetical protein n=2 Tax=Cylindrospermopsis raciborskii TaxID=77022 RepID=UPI00387A345B
MIMENNLSCLFTELSAEEASSVTGGDAMSGAYVMAAFFIANGGAFLTPEQAIVVIAVTLTGVRYNSTLKSSSSNYFMSSNESQNSTSNFFEL